MQTVYVETTVASFYAETRQTPKAIAWRDATRIWWAMARDSHRLVTSRFAIDELQDAPEPKRSGGLALLRSIRS